MWRGLLPSFLFLLLPPLFLSHTQRPKVSFPHAPAEASLPSGPTGPARPLPAQDMEPPPAQPPSGARVEEAKDEVEELEEEVEETSECSGAESAMAAERGTSPSVRGGGRAPTAGGAVPGGARPAKENQSAARISSRWAGPAHLHQLAPRNGRAPPSRRSSALMRTRRTRGPPQLPWQQREKEKLRLRAAAGTRCFTGVVVPRSPCTRGRGSGEDLVRVGGFGGCAPPHSCHRADSPLGCPPKGGEGAS